MYTISFRHEYNLLDIQWQRLFDLAGVERYAAELVGRFRKEGFTNGYRLRIDMGACSVQPVQAAAAGFPRASRIAIVTASAITRLQVQRLMTQPYLRIFDTAEASWDWLTTRDAAATA
jgi:hypothetical protein